MIDSLFKLFGVNFVRTPNDFLKKFIKDSKRKFCILELYYKQNLLVQIENTKYIDKHILDGIDVSNNGLLLSIPIPVKDLQMNKVFKTYKTYKDRFKMKKMIFPDLNSLSIYKKLQNNDVVGIGSEIKEILYSFYSFDEDNPQIVFNIRYPEINSN
jgi:hypothetical protein